MPERGSGILLGRKSDKERRKVPAKKTAKKSAAKGKKVPAKKTVKKSAAKATSNKKTQPTIKVSGDLLVASSAEYSILFDFYGNLLGDRQKDIFALYHEDNLSLTEIAKDLGISRQAVHEALKKAEATLKETEKKLALLRKNEEITYALRSAEIEEQKLREDISTVGLDKKDADRLKRKLRKIIKTIKEMDVE